MRIACLRNVGSQIGVLALLGVGQIKATVDNCPQWVVKMLGEKIGRNDQRVVNRHGSVEISMSTILCESAVHAHYQ